jgi:hypothetical protein
MRIKSFGCSFIFGNDLPDDNRGGLYGKTSRYTWPSLVAQHLGLDYDCYAWPGIGNLRIAERVLGHAACNERNFYIINWTWIDRFDYRDSKHDWRSIMPIDTDDVAGFYYRQLHSQFRDKLTSLIAIRDVINVLEHKKIPFLMTYMDELLFESDFHISPAMGDCQDYIRPYLHKFDGKNFLDWSRDNGYAISPTLHPLEHAHAQAAAYVLEQHGKHISDAIQHKA